jgi:hypothetical protein
MGIEVAIGAFGCTKRPMDVKCESFHVEEFSASLPRMESALHQVRA